MTLPVAVTVFPRDIPRLPRSWIEDTVQQSDPLRRGRQGRALRGLGTARDPGQRNPHRPLYSSFRDANAVEAIGMPGLHFHDLRHTGNQFAANSGAGLRDLMARMGHDWDPGRDDLSARSARRRQGHHGLYRRAR